MHNGWDKCPAQLLHLYKGKESTVAIAETYATCVEQPAQRLYWALVTSLNLTAIGCDVGNAFAEALAPTQPFYMYIDNPFRDLWENCLGRAPIPRGYVLKVNKALQGPPESAPPLAQTQ